MPTHHSQQALWLRGSRHTSPPGRRGRALLPGSFPAERILRNELFLGGLPPCHHPPTPGTRRPEGHPLMPAASRGRGRARSPGSFWKPGVLAALVSCSPDLVAHLDPRGRGQGLPPSLAEPGPAVSADMLLACASVCVCVRGRPAHTLSLAVGLAPKAHSSGVAAPNVPAGCTLPSLARTLPAPRPGASRGTPTPGPAFGTESPHRPAPPLQLVLASTEGLAGSGCPPAHDRDGALPGRGGARLQWLNDSFLKAKDTTTGMEGRWPLAAAAAGAGPGGQQGGRAGGGGAGAEEGAWAPTGLWHV